MLSLWFFTKHTLGYPNENLLQLNPLALIAGIYILGRQSSTSSRIVSLFTLALLVASVAGLTLKLLPWFGQANAPVIATSLPIHAALAWGYRHAPYTEAGVGVTAMLSGFPSTLYRKLSPEHGDT